MKVVITGGAGFLGRRLAAALLQPGSLRGGDGRDRQIERLTLVDVDPPPTFDDSRVSRIVGDLTDRGVLQQAMVGGVDGVFHLAAIVSGRAEADFDLGMRVNVDATRLLLEACRAGGQTPRFVFTSSIAVYGGELPATVPDTTALRPQSSYGAQKAIAELLIGDYTRKGFVDGRVLRLPTISVRPGRPNAAASSFVSGIVREPLNGEEAVCPVDPKTRVWLASPSTAIRSLVAGYQLEPEALGGHRAVNVPGISITAGDMVEALRRVAGPEASKRVRWQRDPLIERIVATWPGALDVTRALALGFPRDECFEAIIREYMREFRPTSSR
jgi:nucleoside-diphosphate-sugar epimerase